MRSYLATSHKAMLLIKAGNRFLNKAGNQKSGKQKREQQPIVMVLFIWILAFLFTDFLFYSMVANHQSTGILFY